LSQLVAHDPVCSTPAWPTCWPVPDLSACPIAGTIEHAYALAQIADHAGMVRAPVEHFYVPQSRWHAADRGLEGTLMTPRSHRRLLALTVARIPTWLAPRSAKNFGPPWPHIVDGVTTFARIGAPASPANGPRPAGIPPSRTSARRAQRAKQKGPDRKHKEEACSWPCARGLTACPGQAVADRLNICDPPRPCRPPPKQQRIRIGETRERSIAASRPFRMPR